MENIEILKENDIDLEGALGLWGDMESYNEALKEYRDAFPQKRNDLKTFIEKEDWNNYAVLAHSIKSEAKYLGFMSDAEVFYEHELKGKANDSQFIKENFSKLEETADKIVSILNEYFGEKKNLLIADDSNIILSFLEKNTKEEFNILKANNGHAAIEKLSNPIYAILLDLNMPGLNGFEVLNYLKEHNLIEKIPVVIITGDDADTTIEKVFSYPILDVLKKPFSETNIKNVLDKIHNFYQTK